MDKTYDRKHIWEEFYKPIGEELINGWIKDILNDCISLEDYHIEGSDGKYKVIFVYKLYDKQMTLKFNDPYDVLYYAMGGLANSSLPNNLLTSSVTVRNILSQLRTKMTDILVNGS